MADDDESLPNRLVEPLKDAVGRIHDENLLFPSVLGILIVISAVALAAMQAASYVIFAVLGGLLVLLLLTILLRHFSPRAPDPPEDRDPHRSSRARSLHPAPTRT